MNQNTPAFPLQGGYEQLDSPCAGMTLRDYFAAQAMQGLVACGCLTVAHEGMVHPFNEIEVADQAYAMADAMLAARQPEQG